GVGLAKVYGIVKEHGGHADVTSEVGRGTTFTVYLPRADLRREPQTRAPDGPREAKAPDVFDSADETLPTGGGELVLLVEDDATSPVASAEALEAPGHTVLPAQTAEAACGRWAPPR